MLFPSSKHCGKNHLRKWCAKSTDAVIAGQLKGCTQYVTGNSLGNLALLGGWLVVLETSFMRVFAGGWAGRERGYHLSFFLLSLLL